MEKKAVNKEKTVKKLTVRAPSSHIKHSEMRNSSSNKQSCLEKVVSEKLADVNKVMNRGNKRKRQWSSTKCDTENTKVDTEYDGQENLVDDYPISNQRRTSIDQDSILSKNHTRTKSVGL